MTSGGFGRMVASTIWVVSVAACAETHEGTPPRDASGDDDGGDDACVLGAACDAGLCAIGVVVGCDPLRCEVGFLEPAGTPCRSVRGFCDIQDLCDGVTPDCVDLVAPDGTPCAGSATCVRGSCFVDEPCGPGTRCDPGSPCENGEIDCSAGEPRCRAVGPQPEGTPCGVGLACDDSARCVVCVSDARCDTGDPCTIGATVCSAGAPACVFADFVPAGTPCLVAGFCDAMGTCVEE